MKKAFAGIVCLAAIAAASVVLLPVAAVKLAVRLSKPRNVARKQSPRAEGEPSGGFLTEQLKIEGSKGNIGEYRRGSNLYP